MRGDYKRGSRFVRYLFSRRACSPYYGENTASKLAGYTRKMIDYVTSDFFAFSIGKRYIS